MPGLEVLNKYLVEWINNSPYPSHIHPTPSRLFRVPWDLGHGILPFLLPASKYVGICPHFLLFSYKAMSCLLPVIPWYHFCVLLQIYFALQSVSFLSVNSCGFVCLWIFSNPAHLMIKTKKQFVFLNPVSLLATLLFLVFLSQTVTQKNCLLSLANIWCTYFPLFASCRHCWLIPVLFPKACNSASEAAFSVWMNTLSKADTGHRSEALQMTPAGIFGASTCLVPSPYCSGSYSKDSDFLFVKYNELFEVFI